MSKKGASDGGDTTKVRPASIRKRKKRDTALSPQRDDPAWGVLERKIGGREGMLRAAMASTNPKAVILAELLLDPAFSNAGTKVLAKKAGLTVPEIVDLYRDRQWLETTMILHEKLPDIIDGATDDAKPRMEPCAECKTSGKSENGDVCWVCGGSGAVRRAGDKDKLRFVGDAVGLTGKTQPLIQTNIQNVVGGQGQSQSFDELMRKATVQVNRPKQIEASEVEIISEELTE